MSQQDQQENMNLIPDIIRLISFRTNVKTCGRLRSTSRLLTTVVSHRDIARMEADRLWKAHSHNAIVRAVNAPVTIAQTVHNGWEDKLPASPATPRAQHWSTWASTESLDMIPSTPACLTMTPATTRRRVPPHIMKHLIPFLIEHGADPAKDGCALRGATECGDLDTVKLLINTGIVSDYMCTEGVSWAARQGQADILQYLVEEAKAGMHSWALFMAADAGHLQIVDMLLSGQGWGEMELRAAADAAAQNGFEEIALRLQRQVDANTFQVNDLVASMSRLVVVA
ncbi:hypothetical protein HDV00_011155 [Rhizophlyctis rosea]|nr:hypothetical protein HDV00_011155 [Rhizophlyctis rosea]